MSVLKYSYTDKHTDNMSDSHIFRINPQNNIFRQDQYSCYDNNNNNNSNNNGCNTQVDSSLYPYRIPRKPKTKTWIQLNIYGSAIVAAYKQIIIIYLINVLVSLLLVYDIIQPSVFPIDNFAFGHIFQIFTFLVSIYYSVAYNNQRVALEEYIIQMMGNTVDAAINLYSLTTDTQAFRKSWRYVYNRHTHEVVVKESNVICLLSDLSFILKSIPYATKHKYRPNSGLEPDKLPMPIELRDELIVAIEKGVDGLDQMRAMYLNRINTMYDIQALPLPSVGSAVSKSDNYGTTIGKIDFLTGRGAMPTILFNLTIVSLWIYCIYLTFALWEYWALQISLYAYYPILLLIVTFLLSLFSSITTISNPFQDPETSNFTFIDLGQIANDTAKTVDASFNITKEQLKVFNESGISKIIYPTATDNKSISK